MTLFKKILGHLDTLIRVIPDTFEVHKPKFKSERLRRLCSLKPIVNEEEDENKEDETEDKDEEKKEKKEEPEKDAETPFASFHHCLWFTIASWVQQGCDFLPRFE